MKQFIFIFIKGVIIGAVIGLVLFGVTKAIEKNDRVTCTKLAEQQKQFALWYATPSERAMCEALDMELPADNTSWPDGFDPILNGGEIK